MGPNKNLRKKIAGEERNIWKHRLKIQEALGQDFPDELMINKWRADIQRSEARKRLLEERLERRRRNAAGKA
ncbi:MAG: hypothetical protein ACRD3D_17835 [Terriglobia bacterium]